jgi:hypothetical protein
MDTRREDEERVERDSEGQHEKSRARQPPVDLARDIPTGGPDLRKARIRHDESKERDGDQREGRDGPLVHGWTSTQST